MNSDVNWAIAWSVRILAFVLPTGVVAIMGFVGLILTRAATPIPIWVLKLSFGFGCLPLCGLLTCFYLMQRASQGGWVISDSIAVIFSLLAFGTGLTGFYAFSPPFRYVSLALLILGLVMVVAHPPSRFWGR